MNAQIYAEMRTGFSHNIFARTTIPSSNPYTNICPRESSPNIVLPFFSSEVIFVLLSAIAVFTVHSRKKANLEE